MKKVVYVIFILLFTTGLAYGQRTVEVDVCVYGGTSAGVIAAFTAQQLGKKALLIEPGRRLGGLTSGGLGYTDIGNKYAISGLSRDFYRRVGRHYGKFEQWIFEPGVAEAIFHDYVNRGGFEVFYESRLREVRKQGNTITEIVLENPANPSAAVTIVKAKMFIDCGYEGDLMARAGVSYTVGREDNRQYNETLNGVQLMNGHQFPDGIDPYKIPGKPKSGLLWGISDEKLLPAGSGDRKVQAYNYRICLTSDPRNRIPITQPEGYDPSRYELLIRLFDAYPDKRKLNDYFIWSRMPNNKTDINNRGAFSTDMIGMNYGYPEGSYEERQKIIQEHTRYTKGLLYFFGHDPRVPLQLRDSVQRWGYPKDEYVESDNWTPQLYIREARRMIGSYVMTQRNCEGRLVVSDGVGMAAYTMDSHNIQRIVVNDQVKNEGNVEVGGFGPYPIAYRSLTPKASECGNLLVPVCLSATHIAFGSIRMEPVFMVLAQSSATAAVMAIDGGTTVQQVDVRALQQRLKADPLANGSLFEILADNRDTLSVQRRGHWNNAARGGYGPDFLVHEPNEEIAYVRFAPEIPKEGAYAGYIYFPKTEGMSKQTLVVINDGARNHGITIKESEIRVEGQTSGEWVSLGTYRLPEGRNSYVQVSAKDADGKVIADAVIWVPADKSGAR
ncbi:MAG: FAD-dependent oxidoreductase [Bacteroidota bacterium]|nr:FAD-dependent oxidoreductase [Bacteroidota bacterium]